MHSSAILVCLMAFVATTLSLPTPPIPADPALKLEISEKGLKEISAQIKANKFGLEKDVPIEFTIDDAKYKGTFDVTSLPELEIKSVANDRDAESYEGFDSVSSSDSHDRFRREAGSAHAKVLYEDKEFLGTKKLGGIKASLDDFNIHFDLKHENTHYLIDGTNVHLKVTTLLGNDGGQLRQGLIAAELDGNLEIKKDDNTVELTEEKRNEYYKKILELIVLRYKKEFTKEVTEFIQVLGSQRLPHIYFDFRLTEDPVFKNGGLEVNVVGKFIYDEQDSYKYSKISELDNSLVVLQYLEGLKSTTDYAGLSANTYTTNYELLATSDTPNVDELKKTGSDEAEAERKGLYSVRAHINEEFFNSFFHVLVESKLLDFTITKQQVEGLAALYSMQSGGDSPDLSFFPQNLKLRIKLIGAEGDKYVQFHEDKKSEQVAVAIGFGDAKAEYHLKIDSSFLFRNGKEAYDITNITVVKKADEAFPKLFSNEEMKALFEEYYKAYKHTLTNNAELAIFSELSLKEKHVILGFNLNNF